MARRNIGVATFAHWWGYKWEAWDGIPQNAGILAEHGVKVAIHSDSPDLIQRLYEEAAIAMRYGLSREDALKAITLNPAWILGVDDRVGSLDVGKDADIAIFSKDPFDIYTRVEKTLVDGKVVYDRSKAPAAPAALGTR
ncbi:MAG: amidohydrolase family protein [Acidobacteria bacterium]|nr:amidohydrolase family protein [Acidobacteriota bacterium]